MMPSWLTLKLGAMILGAAAILSFVVLAFHWKHTMTERGEKLTAICQSTRDASGQPKLKCSDLPQQIKFMGEAIGTLTQAIHKQNDAVAAMGAETARQQQDAAQAAQEAAQRAEQPRKVSDSLIASSRAPERSSAPCDASKALQGAWK